MRSLHMKMEIEPISEKTCILRIFQMVSDIIFIMYVVILNIRHISE
jgi:hypothetical protein